MANNNEVSGGIDHEAYAWVALAHSDGASDEELAELDAWLAADPRHAAAFSRLETLFNDVGELKDMAHLIDAPAVSETSRAEGGAFGKLIAHVKGALARPMFPAGALAAGLAAVVFIVAVLPSPPAEPRRYATAIAEVRAISLDDGSTITLGARSVAEVTYADETRRVALLNGQAFFDVARDPGRPFLIDAGAADIEVLGTTFDVTLLGDETRVAVVEGLVSVASSDTATAQKQITAGEALSATRAGLSEIRTANIEILSAWRDGRLIFENAPLSEVIASVNRYTARPVELAPDVNAALTVTGAFSADDAEAVIRTIAATHGLAVEPAIDGVRVLTPRAVP